MKAAVFSFIDYAHAAAAQFFCNFVMGEGLSQERLRIRHSVAILGCERNQVNEMARQSLLSPLAALAWPRMDQERICWLAGDDAIAVTCDAAGGVTGVNDELRAVHDGVVIVTGMIGGNDGSVVLTE